MARMSVTTTFATTFPSHQTRACNTHSTTTDKLHSWARAHTTSPTALCMHINNKHTWWQWGRLVRCRMAASPSRITSFHAHHILKLTTSGTSTNKLRYNSQQMASTSRKHATTIVSRAATTNRCVVPCDTEPRRVIRDVPMPPVHNWNRSGIMKALSASQPVQEVHVGFSGVYLHRLDLTRPHPDVPTVYKFGCARDIAKRLCDHASSQHNRGNLCVEFVMTADDHYALERHGLTYLSTPQENQWGGKRTCTLGGSVPRKELFEIEDVEAFREHLRTFEGAQELSLEVLGTSQSVIGKHLAELVQQQQTTAECGVTYLLVPGTHPLNSTELQTRRAHFSKGISLKEVVYLTKTGNPRLHRAHAFPFVKQRGKETRYSLSDLRYDLKLGVVRIEVVYANEAGPSANRTDAGCKGTPPYDEKRDEQEESASKLAQPLPCTRFGSCDKASSDSEPVGDTSFSSASPAPCDEEQDNKQH